MNYYRKDDLSFVPFSPEEEKALFKRYREEKDLEARDKILLNYLQFAAKVGLAVNKGRWPEDEVYSAANLGLLTAIDRFDYKQCRNGFSAFAREHIRGAVLDNCPKIPSKEALTLDLKPDIINREEPVECALEGRDVLVREAIAERLRTMPKLAREVFLARAERGMPFAAIVRSFGRTETEVRRAYDRAIFLLREALAE